MHGNWVVYFRTWRRRCLFSGRALTCRSRSNVWNSQKPIARHHQNSRPKSFVRISLPKWTSSAQPQRSKIWGSVSGRDRVARARCPRSSVEAGQKCVEIKKSVKEQHSSHLRKIGACLHQILNLRNENLLWTPERRCIWSAERTWVMLKWILWRNRAVLR